MFLGVPFTDTLRAQLNPNLFSLFKDYLVEVVHNKQSYLAKECGIMSTVDQLDNLESHITSLLKRLAPNCDPKPCQLITSLL